jgi:hypothetical protein
VDYLIILHSNYYFNPLRPIIIKDFITITLFYHFDDIFWPRRFSIPPFITIDFTIINFKINSKQSISIIIMVIIEFIIITI